MADERRADERRDGYCPMCDALEPGGAGTICRACGRSHYHPLPAGRLEQIQAERKRLGVADYQVGHEVQPRGF
jgi:hypothetical protein